VEKNYRSAWNRNMTRIESRFGIGVRLMVLDGTKATQYLK
jgi:hypothetical protein